VKKHRIEAFTRGWFIGDFQPSLVLTQHFETAMKTYAAGDKEAAHLHSIAREFTIIGSGRFRMNGRILQPGDIVEIDPGEVADFECLENGVTFVVKTPSAPKDKVLVNG
jgi:mannose-6-phosphate isomerase-like protein (cupin superfamily)